MPVKAFFEKWSGPIEEALGQALPLHDGPAAKLYEAMRYSLMAGGKRMRPLICLAAAQTVGGRPQAALPAAVALEMIHCYSLIHDDLPAMDDDDLRRGRPANHKVFGEGLAILAGDGLLTAAFDYLSQKGLEDGSDEKFLKTLVIISRAAGAEGMVGGQCADLVSEGGPADLDLVNYIHATKTAALIKAAAASGAVLGGGDDSSVESLGEYGLKIGLAFQIVDDLLDIEGDPAKTGKPAGSDEAKGKATYPRVLGLSRSRTIAAELIDEAKDALAGFGSAGETLRAIADHLLTRKK